MLCVSINAWILLKSGASYMLDKQYVVLDVLLLTYIITFLQTAT